RNSNDVSVVDPKTNSFLGNIGLPGAQSPQGIAFSPSGSRLYVANGGSNNLSVVDVATHARVQNVPLPQALGPSGVAVNPMSGRIYTANTQSNNVSVVDPIQLQSIAVIDVTAG